MKRRSISALLDIPIANPPFTYLGISFFFGSPKFFQFTKLLDALKAKLSGRRAKALSFAERLILVKHVLSSMPLYISLCTPFPEKVSLHIERILRNFLWSIRCLKTKHNQVRWENICSLNLGLLGHSMCLWSQWCMRVETRVEQNGNLLHLGNLVHSKIHQE